MANALTTNIFTRSAFVSPEVADFLAEQAEDAGRYTVVTAIDESAEDRAERVKEAARAAVAQERHDAEFGVGVQCGATFFGTVFNCEVCEPNGFDWGYYSWLEKQYEIQQDQIEHVLACAGCASCDRWYPGHRAEIERLAVISLIGAVVYARTTRIGGGMCYEAIIRSDIARAFVHSVLLD